MPSGQWSREEELGKAFKEEGVPNMPQLTQGTKK